MEAPVEKKEVIEQNLHKIDNRKNYTHNTVTP